MAPPPMAAPQMAAPVTSLVRMSSTRTPFVGEAKHRSTSCEPPTEMLRVRFGRRRSSFEARGGPPVPARLQLWTAGSVARPFLEPERCVDGDHLGRRAQVDAHDDVAHVA